MDTVKSYQNFILQLLEAYAAIPPSYPTTLKDEVVADKQGNHFQLLTLGWENGRFIHETVFHLDIIDGKIWIQQNNTEADIAQELVDLGVPKTDIVIGFQKPELRALSGYAQS